ncbi:hypothetical protein [Roseibium sp.]|uniref:hypothetical protein n=1 Tax=Roseibium sp. TaxID=1936156 RepID=UPI003D144A5B
MLRVAGAIVYIAAVLLWLQPLKAEPLKLRVPDVSTTDYMIRLLTESLQKIGETVEFQRIDPDFNMARQMLLFETGDGLDLIWRGEDANLKEAFLEVDVDLTEGLKGYRVVFVNPEDVDLFRNVRTLEEFLALGKVAALGAGWNDVDVWQANGMRYLEFTGTWDPEIYQLLALGGRGIDYFPRGITEITGEAQRHPELAVDPYLGLVYPNDFRFYVTKSNVDLHRKLSKALKLAEQDGTLSRLLRETNPLVFDKSGLNIDGRTVIELAMP